LIRRASSSIGWRITFTVTATTACALAIACGGFAVHLIQSTRAALVSDLASLADVIGSSSMMPLASGDAALVEATLLALVGHEGIEAAAVYGRERRIFARFARDYEGAPRLPELAPLPGTRTQEGAIVVVRPVEAGGEQIGSVLLRRSTPPLLGQIGGTLGVAAGALAVCLVPALLGVRRLRRDLAKPLAELARGAERLAAGDLGATVALRRSDEIGLLGDAFDRMAEQLRGLLSELSAGASDVLASTRTLADSSRRSRNEAETQRSSVERTVEAIARIESSLGAVSGATDKLGEATSATAASASQVQASTLQVRDSTRVLFELIQETAAALDQCVASIREIGERIEQLVSASERTNSSLDRARESIRRVDDASMRGLELARGTADAAASVKQATEETVAAMGTIDSRFRVLQSTIAELGSRSTAIGDVVEVIDQVAAETKLLSLNASIVATQAGQHGKAFNVVAGQIAKLAERTASSSREITQLIRSVQATARQAVTAAAEGSQSVDEGVRRTRGAADALGQIIASAGESSSNVSGIAEASQRQSQALREVEDAFRGVREVLTHIGRAVTEQRRAAGRVHEAMERTSEVTQQVERAGAEQVQAVERIAAAAHETEALTSQVSASTLAQSRDSRQVIQALGLFRDIAGRTVENAEDIQRVVELLGRRAETLAGALRRMRLEAREEEA
jgi:methyl-accepting chemotaxis protein